MFSIVGRSYNISNESRAPAFFLPYVFAWGWSLRISVTPISFPWNFNENYLYIYTQSEIILYDLRRTILFLYLTTTYANTVSNYPPLWPSGLRTYIRRRGINNWSAASIWLICGFRAPDHGIVLDAVASVQLHVMPRGFEDEAAPAKIRRPPVLMYQQSCWPKICS